MSEGFPEADKDIEWLHGTMATATAHMEAVRVDPVRLRRAQRRRRLSEGGVAAGVLSVALVATTIGMSGGGGAAKTPALTGPAVTSQPRPTAPTVPAQVVVPKAVAVYDSDNGNEGKETLNKLLAGTGAWETNQYCGTRATHDGVPKGTGLIFDLGAPTHLTTVTVDIGTPGADMEVWAGDSTVKWPVPDLPNQPPDGFGKAASVSAAAAGGKNVFQLAGYDTRYVLVWFSGTLPVVPNPDASIRCANGEGTRYGDSITSVQFAGVSTSQ